jgi:uncharacterized iron-regulated protein
MELKNPVKSPVKKPVKNAVKSAVKSPSPTAVKTAVSKPVEVAKAPVRKTAVKDAAKPESAATTKSAAAQAKAKAADQAKEKVRKPKLVRDSFTMPEEEYRVLNDVKKACIKAGFEVKKSELLRVGVALIRNMDLAALKNVLTTLPPLKAGRPKREK